MPLRHKRLVEIRASDIRGLITRKVSEGQFVDFKGEMYSHNDDGKHELAKDASSFANAYGGDIFIGVAATNGIATTVAPVKSGPKETEWLLQVCHDLIEERISGLDAVPVRVKGGNVVVVRVPPSLRGPHMVRRGRQTYFYRRYGQQSSPMSLPDIREAFMRFSAWQQQTKEFFAERQALLGREVRYAIGILPVPIQDNLVSISDERIRQLLWSPPNTRSNGWRARAGRDIRATLFGLVSEVPNRSVLQLWRSGFLELAVDTSEDNIDNLRIVRHVWENEPGRPTDFVVANPIPVVEFAVTTVRLAQAVQKHVAYDGPNAILLYLSTYGKPKMPAPDLPDQDAWKFLGPQALNEPIPYPIFVGPYFVDTLSNPDAAAKIGLDLLWNAFGHDHAPFFRPTGRCTVPGLPPAL